MFLHYFLIITNCLYVCQSFSWITSLLKLGQYRDISCFAWDIFQIFLGDIPPMILHYCKIDTNFLYVCQFVSWLTSLLKLGSSRDISSYGWDLFLNLFGGFPGTFSQWIQIILNFLYVCKAVSLLFTFLKSCQYRDISSSGQDKSMTFFGDIDEIFLDYYRIILNLL